MNKFTQRVPNYVDLGGPPPSFEFETLEELLNHEIVQRYTKSEEKKFTHWARSDEHLMAMYGEDKWWCVGRIQDISVLESLPYYQACE